MVGGGTFWSFTLIFHSSPTKNCWWGRCSSGSPVGRRFWRRGIASFGSKIASNPRSEMARPAPLLAVPLPAAPLLAATDRDLGGRDPSSIHVIVRRHRTSSSWRTDSIEKLEIITLLLYKGYTDNSNCGSSWRLSTYRSFVLSLHRCAVQWSHAQFLPPMLIRCEKRRLCWPVYSCWHLKLYYIL